jgi:excisionase family DNA binding protein
MVASSTQIAIPVWSDRANQSREPANAVDRNFEPCLDSQQAAQLLRIHPKTLQRMARRGKLPGYRVGDLWRFRASELDRSVR